MAGKRRELAAVGRLVKREEDEGEASRIAEAIEEGFERARIFGRGWNIGADVAAKACVKQRVVVAQ
jgi:hypothetical protein